jgi:rubrerythrin
MSKTRENHLKAFAGESMANHKYLAFAQKAEEEGHQGIADLFRARAEQETSHALEHARRLDMIKTTKENIEAAISGETDEYSEMYPRFAQEAREEGDEDSARFFQALAEIEEYHAQDFFKALQKLEGKQLKWRCDVCGNVLTEDEPPERCPVCGAAKEYSHLTD